MTKIIGMVINRNMLAQLKNVLREPRRPEPKANPVFEMAMYSVNWVAATVFQHNFIADAKNEIAIKVVNRRNNNINTKIRVSFFQKEEDKPIIPNKRIKALK